MGYTHYWYRPKELDQTTFNAAVADCRPVLDWLQDRGVEVQEGYNHEGPPVLNSTEVRFNGIGGQGHETMHIQQTCVSEAWEEPQKDGTWFSFCKTARKPYDAAVCAVLIIFALHFGDAFEVASDGDENAEGWQLGLRACRTVLGRGDIPLPERGVDKSK